MANHFVNSTLKPVTAESGDANQQEVLNLALKQVGFIPNMYANMVNLAPVLSTYLHGYAEFRNKSGFNPVEQEVVFLALSLTNGCQYCGAAHSMLADKMSGVPADVLAAIREGNPIPDAKLQTLYDFTVELVEQKAKSAQPLARNSRQRASPTNMLWGSFWLHRLKLCQTSRITFLKPSSMKNSLLTSWIND